MDQRTIEHNQNFLNSMSDAFLMRAGCFTPTDKALDFASFFLSRQDHGALIIARDQSSGHVEETLRGVAYPATEGTGAHIKPVEGGQKSISAYLRDGTEPALYKEMVLVPQPYLEEQGLSDYLELLMHAKLNEGQNVISGNDVVNWGYFQYNAETGNTLFVRTTPIIARDMKAEGRSMDFRAKAGEKFDDALIAGDYVLDIEVPEYVSYDDEDHVPTVT